jgi:hypothetical protein
MKMEQEFGEYFTGKTGIIEQMQLQCWTKSATLERIFFGPEICLWYY